MNFPNLYPEKIISPYSNRSEPNQIPHVVNIPQDMSSRRMPNERRNLNETASSYMPYPFVPFNDESFDKMLLEKHLSHMNNINQLAALNPAFNQNQFPFYSNLFASHPYFSPNNFNEHLVNFNKKSEQENKTFEKPSKRSSKKANFVLEHATNIKEEMVSDKSRVDLNKSDSSTSRTQTLSDPHQSFSASRSQSPMYLRGKRENEEANGFEQVEREPLSLSSKLSVGFENSREKSFENEDLHENDSFLEEEEEEHVEHDEDELIEEEIEDEEDGDLNTTSTSDNYFIKSPMDEGKSKAIGVKEDNLNNVIYDFTLQALEASLYGYLRQKDNIYHGHAISGFMLPNMLPDKPHMSANSKANAFQMDEEFIPTNKGNFSLSSASSTSSSTTSATCSSFEVSTKSTPKSKDFSIDNLLVPSTDHASRNQCQKVNLHNNGINFEEDRIDLPDELQIRMISFGNMNHYGIFCKKTVINKNTRFGPFPGKQLKPNELKSNRNKNNMWEIFNDGKLSHLVDANVIGNDGVSHVPNQWMMFVNCARFAQEQNLIAIQCDGEIYYETCKDIVQGQELLIWYGDSYLQFLGIPVSLKDMTDEMSEEPSENKEGYSCDRCGKVFAYKYYRDKHLKYTRCVDQGDRKFPCHLCSRSFEKRDRLRIHILHVHEKHRPHKCTVCGKSFSQSSSLNKHMRVHSGERPYKCIYCNKAFTASSILRTHIRQHSGEKPFKCKYCGKAFASHAAHDSHVRRTHFMNKDKPSK